MLPALSGVFASKTNDDNKNTLTTYIKWAAVACSIPAALYVLRGKGDDYRTDFDGFLKTPEEKGSTGTAKLQTELKSGPIDGFYKCQDERNPLDFNTFLKSNTSEQAAATKPAQKDEQAERPSPDMSRVVVIFGTEYGFSKEIAEKLCSKLKASKKYWPKLLNMAEYPEGYDLSKEQAVFMACSTQGDGVPPTEAREFCEWLFAGKCGALADTVFSVIALGDKSYTHFCRCGKMLDEALAKAGAQRIVDCAQINKEDWPAVDAWLDAVASTLPQHKLKTLAELGDLTFESSDTKKATAKRWGKSRPYAARVVAIEGLCTITDKSDKNTTRVELDLGDSGLTYLPGDALGIYPTNAPQAVEDLLAALQADGTEDVPVPSWHYEEAGLDQRSSMPLKEALLKCYDLRSPRPDIFKLLWSLLPTAICEAASSYKSTDAASNGHADGHHEGNGVVNGNHHANGTSNGVETPMLHQAIQLYNLIQNPDTQEEYFKPRHVIDVLQDFASASQQVAPIALLPCLRQLQPRLYSISSSPLENPASVQATVAEVKYKSLGAERIGVCSTQLSERLEVGQTLPVYIHKNPDFRLPADASTPIIMVGPGTGLAPFRSFILQRLLEAEQSQTPCGEMVLYFGCRRSDQDYLYGDVLEQWAKEGKITLHTAFSRQTSKKVYVQQRLRDSGEQVWKLLESGAHFYVCGDASSMAGAVEVALLDIIQQGLGAGHEEAKAYLDRLSDSHRYERDVWY